MAPQVAWCFHDGKLVAFNGEAWEHHGKIHMFFVYQ
jgi:hypothetical protein